MNLDRDTIHAWWGAVLLAALWTIGATLSIFEVI